MKCKKASQMQI